jgi:hypothetical protein
MAENNNRSERNTALSRAQNHFAKADQRDVLVREEMTRARTVFDTKTAKLKALRLAKEEAERIAAAEAPPAAAKPRKSRKKAVSEAAAAPKKAAE